MLVWGDLALAALSVSYHKFHYSSNEKNQIMIFGFSKLMQSIADLDPLTMISKRRNFMLKAETYFERHKKAQKPAALLFIDIDRFKQINDTSGHLVGDEILKKVACEISDGIRPMDLCCRYGGEEFVVFLY